MTDSKLITAGDLELAPGPEDLAAYDLRAARARAEREVIQRALARSDGRLAAAAPIARRQSPNPLHAARFAWADAGQCRLRCRKRRKR